MASGLLHALQVGGDSVEAATSTSAGEVAIPTLNIDVAVPERPRWVYVACEEADLAIEVRPGPTGQPIAAGTGLVVRGNGEGIVLNVAGATHIAHIAGSGTPTLHVTPLANQ